MYPLVVISIAGLLMTLFTGVAIDEALVFDRRVKDAAHELLAGDTRARRVIAASMASTMQQMGLGMLAQGRITLSDLKI